MGAYFQDAGSSRGALKQYQDALNNYQNAIIRNSGENGFNKTLDLSKIGANQYASEIGRQATNAARASGLNKSQAAALGAKQAAGNYANVMQNQQGLAAGQLQSLLNGLGNYTGAQGSKVAMGSQYDQMQNAFNQSNIQGTIQDIGRIASIAAPLMALSDERAKDSVNLTDKKIDLTAEMSKIDSYLFKYKDKIQDEYNGEHGVDDEPHVGIMAQELAENPITAGAIQEGEDGYLEVDTGKLCMALTAVTSDMAKKIGELEFEIKMLKGGK